MKEQFVDRVVNGMLGVLDPEQFQRLKQVLWVQLQGLEIIVELSDVPAPAPGSNEQYVNMFLASKQVAGCSERTIRQYQYALRHFLLWLHKDVSEVVPADIWIYLAEYEKKSHAKKISVENERKKLSTFFSWMENQDYIRRSPMRKVERVRTESTMKKAFSAEEVELLRDACMQKQDLRGLALIDVLVSTGMRVGELCRLNRDIDVGSGKITVYGKGGKQRTVYLNGKAKIHLQKYLDTRTDTGPELFRSQYGRLSVSGVEYILKYIGQLAGVNDVYPHKFRRTMATWALHRGMPIEKLRILLGHSSVNTTLIYCVILDREVEAEHEKYVA